MPQKAFKKNRENLKREEEVLSGKMRICILYELQGMYFAGPRIECAGCKGGVVHGRRMEEIKQTKSISMYVN